MKISKLFSAVLIAGASYSAQAGVLLSEGFDNLATSGWTQVGGNGWFQGNPVYTADTGAAGSHAGNNFLSSTLTISEWLMSPVLSVGNGAALNFALRLVGDGFLDTVEVYTSNSGASTDTNDFTTLLGVFNNSGADTGWTLQSLTLSAFTGRIGFRYYVADSSVDGNYVGIDSVSVVPEPTSVALVALALAGVAATRRRT